MQNARQTGAPEIERQDDWEWGTAGERVWSLQRRRLLVFEWSGWAGRPGIRVRTVAVVSLQFGACSGTGGPCCLERDGCWCVVGRLIQLSVYIGIMNYRSMTSVVWLRSDGYSMSRTEMDKFGK